MHMENLNQEVININKTISNKLNNLQPYYNNNNIKMIDLPKHTKKQDNKNAATKALALTRKADKILAESNITKHTILSDIYGMS